MPAIPLSNLMPSLFPAQERARPDSAPLSGARACRSTRKAAQWAADLTRSYGYLLGRQRDPQQREALGREFEAALQEGPDFLRVRRDAQFGPVPAPVYSREAAAEIMKQAREIERGSYAARAKGKHGGALGRTAIQLLEWFCFVMWPKARYGMFPSLAHIAEQARMSKDTVVSAIKTLELHGFLTVIRRRKRVQTAFGPKQVQDTNGYALNLAKGLGALALAVFGKRSESNSPAAKETNFYLQNASGRIHTSKRNNSGFWGTLKDAWETS